MVSLSNRIRAGLDSLRTINGVPRPSRVLCKGGVLSKPTIVVPSERLLFAPTIVIPNQPSSFAPTIVIPSQPLSSHPNDCRSPQPLSFRANIVIPTPTIVIPSAARNLLHSVNPPG